MIHLKRIYPIRTIFVSAAIVLVLALAANAQDAREEFHKTYPLKADGSISLQNVNGSLTITAWDRNEVRVDAVKIASDRGRLAELRIDVTAGSGAIDIHTRYPHGSTHGKLEVNYTLTVPRNARIDRVEMVNGNVVIEGVHSSMRIETVNGAIRVNGAAGELSLKSVNGAVEAKVSRLGDRSALDCVNGNVNLTLPSDANGEITASTIHGNITNSFSLPVHKPRYGPGSKMHGRLGNGGGRINISTVNGNINVQHDSDGKPLSKATSLLPEDNGSSY